MKKFDDFDLDVVEVSKGAEKGTRITSVSLCTPGCVTGILMGCNLQTVTCNCNVGIGK